MTSSQSPVYGRKTPKVGETAQVRKTMTVADQGLFCGISCNMHPLYVNEVHAKGTEAGGRLVFELAVASLATTALAEVGGPYRRLAALNLRFPAPTRIGDTVAAKVEVVESMDALTRCRVTCLKDEGNAVVAEGSAELAEVR